MARDHILLIKDNGAFVMNRVKNAKMSTTRISYFWETMSAASGSNPNCLQYAFFATCKTQEVRRNSCKLENGRKQIQKATVVKLGNTRNLR